MRDFFIRSLDVLIGIFVVFAVIGIIVASAAMMSGGMSGPGGMPMQGGVGSGVALLVVGLLYVCFIAGFLYLGVGIYHNTRRTAEATERMANQSAKARL